MMGDAIDAGLDTADDVEAADKVYLQICDEIGVDLTEDNPMAAGKGKLPSGPAVSIVIIHIFRKWKKTICKHDSICSSADQNVLTILIFTMIY